MVLHLFSQIFSVFTQIFLNILVPDLSNILEIDEENILEVREKDKYSSTAFYIQVVFVYFQVAVYY